MKLPKVSILIPCYNAERWIEGAIKSALTQDYNDTEVIVVDDGSTDNSWGIIEGFGPRIRTERTSNRGAGSARNYLLELSQGEWLQYLDADDYLLPNKISDQVTILENISDADLIYSPEIFEYHWSKEVVKDIPGIPEPRDPWILLAKWRLPQTGAALWRKQSIMDVGGWKEDQPCCQEHELYLRLLKKGKKFIYCTDSGAVYRKWSDDTICERDQSETYRQRLKIIDEADLYLRESDNLSIIRQDEINQARFECARIIWNFNRDWSRSLIEKIHNTDAPFVPRGRGVPSFYRFIYSLFGFSFTEHIAGIRRKLIYCLSIKHLP